jgi:hypothetical protein
MRTVVCTFQHIDPKAKLGTYLSAAYPGPFFHMSPLGALLSNDLLCDGEEIVISDATEISVVFEHPCGISVEKLRIDGSRRSLARQIATHYQLLYRMCSGVPHTNIECLVLHRVWKNMTNGLYELELRS